MQFHSVSDKGTYFLFTRDFFFTKNNMTVISHSPYSPNLVLCCFSLFLQLKIGHFDTIEMIDAESQAILNTLTEHDFQDVFKKFQKH
jgi:hypothetical protein